MTDLLSRTGASRSSEHPVPRNRRRGPIRVWHDKAGRLAKYRIASTEAALYEDDLEGPQCADSGPSRPKRGRQQSSSRPEDSHLRALPDPYVNLSIHTAPDVRPFP